MLNFDQWLLETKIILSPREAYILWQHGHFRILRDLAGSCEISVERVRQIEEVALKRLRTLPGFPQFLLRTTNEGDKFRYYLSGNSSTDIQLQFRVDEYVRQRAIYSKSVEQAPK